MENNKLSLNCALDRSNMRHVSSEDSVREKSATQMFPAIAIWNMLYSTAKKTWFIFEVEKKEFNIQKNRLTKRRKKKLSHSIKLTKSRSVR